MRSEPLNFRKRMASVNKLSMALGALLTAAVSFGATSTVVSKAVGPVSVTCENPGGWTLSVSLGRAADGVETVDIALTNATRAVPPEFKVTFDVPEQGMVHFWRPESIWTGQHLAMSKVKTRTNLVEWTPVYMVFNERDENRLAVALSEDVLPVTTTTGIREEDCASAWEIVYFKDADALRTGYSTRIRLDRRAVKTCEAIRSAADWICEARGFMRMPSPAHTYGPLYSTWYTFHRELDEKRVEAEYARAAKLGMTTAILDSGWQQEDSSLIAICNGDWDPAPNRFPDMKAHVARVHAMGLKYMLWFGPPFMGKRAKNFERFKGMYHHVDHKWSNCGFLDPRYPEVREYITERLVRAVRDWGFDGLKLDFLYDFQAMGQDPAKEKGYAGCDYRNISEATEAMMAEIRRRLVAVKPDVRLEIHMCYMTPSICRYGNQQHASDSCGSSAANRVAIAALRLTSGDMAVHADMLAWNAAETPEDVGHMILGSIFGTIQYSVDLGKLSDAHTRVLRHWIDFTKAHEATLQHGRFTPHYPDREYPVIEAESAAERIVAVYKENCVADTGALDRPVLVVNGSGAKTVTLRVASAPARVRAYDVYGNEVTAPTVRAGLQDVAIPVSGCLVFERVF